MNYIKLLYIDLFCGAGGTSTGVANARLHGRKCAKVVACVNHDANAIASHQATHPELHTKHLGQGRPPTPHVRETPTPPPASALFRKSANLQTASPTL